MSNLCRFCDISNNKVDGIENRPIIKNDDYYAIPSIGALVEGWILIVPRKHSCSMKDLYADDNFRMFVNQVLSKVWTFYDSKVIAFEHGPNKMSSKTSCGTDHAHLHIVPYENSLIEDIHSSGLTWVKCRSSQISTYAKENEYLFYSELDKNGYWSDPVGYLHILEKPISQFFRKIIANQLNCIDKYDYKVYKNIDSAISTQRLLSNPLGQEQE